MVEKKEKVVCTPVHLRIDSEDLLGSLCTWGEKLEFKPADEKQLKKLKEL